MRIKTFEWDDGNIPHLQLGHGIAPEEAEQAFVGKPYFRKTKKGHYAVFGKTRDGRYLTIVFESMQGGVARPITGWDMSSSELNYYKRKSKKRR